MAKNRLGSAIVIGLFLGLGAAMQGCGDDGDDLSLFVGTWQYTQSAGAFTCTGSTPTDFTFSGRKIWGAGVTSDLVDLTDNCNYKFDVKGKVATIQAMQSCTFSDGSAEIPSSWRFSLLSPTTAEEVTATSLDGTSCSLNVSSQLTKLSKN